MKMKLFLFAAILFFTAPLLLNANSFSPWDAWRQGYTMFEKGQQQRDRGSYRRALQYFESALESYEAVRRARPDWNQKIIQGRIDDCRKAIAAVKLQLDDAGSDLFPQTPASGKSRPNVPSSSRLPDGIERQSYPQIFVGGESTTAPLPGASLSNAEFEAQRAELNKLRTENERFKNRLLQTMVELDDLRRQLARNKSSAEEVSNLLREQRVMQEKYALLEKRYSSLENESKKPDSRLAELRNQLLEARMNYDLLQKRLELSESRLKTSTDANSEIPMLKKAYEKLSAEKEKSIREYERKLSELKNIQQSGIEERNQLRAQMDQLSLQIKTQREELASRTMELNSFRKKFSDALKSGGNAEALNKRIVEENRQLQEKVTSLFTQLTAEQKKTVAATSEQKNLMQELLSVRERIKLHEIKTQELQSELQDIRKGAERDRTLAQQATNQVKTLQGHNQQLSMDLKAWAAKAQKLEKRLNSQLNQSYKLQSDLDSAAQQAKEQLAATESQQKNLKIRIRELEDSQKELQKKLDAEHGGMLKEKSGRLVLANKLKEENSKAAELQKKLDNAAKELRLFIEMKVNFAALQKENAKNKDELQKLSEENKGLKRTAEKAGQFKELQKQIADLQKQNQSLSDKNRQLQVTLADQKEITMITERLKILQKENARLSKELPALHQKASEYDLIKNKLARAEERAEQLNSETQKNAGLQVKIKQLQTLEPQIAALKKELSQQGELHKQKEAALLTQDELQKKEIVRLQQQLQKDLVSHNQQIAKLQQQLQSDQAVLNQQVAKLQQQLQGDQAVYNQQLAKLQQQLQNSNTAHNQQVSELQQQLQNSKAIHARQVSELQQQLQDNKAAHTRQVSELQQQQQDRNTAHNQQISELQQQLQNSKAAYTRQVSELQQQLQNNKAANARQIASSSKSLSKNQIKIEQLQRQHSLVLAELRKQHQITLEQQQKQYQTMLDQRQKQYQTTLDQRQKQYQTMLEQRQNQHKSLLDQQQKQYQSALAQQLKQQQALVEQLQKQLQNTLDQQQKQHKAALEQQQKQHQTGLDQRQKQQQIALEQQQKQYQIALEELRQKNHQLEVSNKSLQHNAEQLNTRLAQLTALARQRESAEKKMLELTVAMSKAAQQMNVLQQEKKRSKDDYELLQQQIKILQKENRELAATRIQLPAIPSGKRPLDLDIQPVDLQISDKNSKATPPQLIASGKQAESEGNQELAIWHYRAALEKDPNNMEAAGLLGNIYLKRDDFRRAEPLLALARSVDPEDTTFAVANAKALIGLSKYGNALALLEPMLRKSPKNPDLLLLTAKAFTGAGQSESARNLLLDALDKYPDNPQFQLEYARMLLAENKGQEKEAAEYYQNYLSLGGTPDLELQPKLAKLLNEQRELQSFMNSAAAEAEKNNDWNAACWYYRQQLNGNTHNSKLAAKLAFAYFMNGQHPAAAEVLAMNPASPFSNLVGALLQYSQGEYAGAAQKAREARRLNRNAPINLTKEWQSLKRELKKLLDKTTSAQQKQAAEVLQGVYL